MTQKVEHVIMETIELELDEETMKFLSFLENQPLKDPETGASLGSDTEIVGMLSAKEVATSRP